MIVTLTTQIELDERGIAWIAGSGVKVTEVVLNKLVHGWSPEETHFQHPHLSLAQIHAALAYYYENEARLNDQIRNDLKESEALQPQASDPNSRARLNNLKRALMDVS